jgi:hypothetical protein
MRSQARTYRELLVPELQVYLHSKGKTSGKSLQIGRAIVCRVFPRALISRIAGSPNLIRFNDCTDSNGFFEFGS